MSSIRPRRSKGYHKVQGSRYLGIKSQHIISSGVLSLDSIIGGGIPLGTIVLLEKDGLDTASNFLMKYFFAEGLACKHSIFVASNDVDPISLVQDIPVPVQREPSLRNIPNEGMEIAWRYCNTPVIESNPEVYGCNLIGHSFDITKTIPDDVLNLYDCTYWSSSETDIKKDGNYQDLTSTLYKTLKNRNYMLGQTPGSATKSQNINMLRIGIHNIGSGFWPEAIEQLPHFLYTLHSLVRKSYSVALITLPTYLIKDKFIISQCEHLCDYIMNFETLPVENNSLYSDYNGLMNISKLPTLNTLAFHIPESADWGYKIRKQKLIIEKLHLPPELPSSKDRELDFNKSSCGSGSFVPDF